jgi:hypothetical protein
MNKTIIAVALIATLAFAIVGASSFATPVFAAGKPGGVPPFVSTCGTAQSAAAGDCAQANHPTGRP